MGIKNTKAFWPPNFPAEDKTLTLGNGPAEKFKHEPTQKEWNWIKYNDRTFAVMASHYGSDPNTKAVLYAHFNIGYPNKSFAPIEINVGESFTLYDVKIELSHAENSPEGISTTYTASKAIKSDPVDLNLDSTTQFDFKTVMRYNHDGNYYYMTLGSIGERHVEFFIWNGVLDLVETVSFRTNKWCKVGNFIFNLKSSTSDTADLFVKKQNTRDVELGDITLSFDEIIRIKNNDKLVTMQVVKMAPLHPGYFDLWCTLEMANNQEPITGYLKDMREREKQEFAITYSVQCKLIQHPENEAPKYNLEVNVVDSPTVNSGEEFMLLKNQSVTLKGTDLKIRFDGSSHKHLANGGGAVGFFHLTITIKGKESEQRFSVNKDGSASFTIDSYSGNLIKTEYDRSVTLVLSKPSNKRKATHKIV